MYINLNLNPKNKKVGDCVVRAIALATNQSWDKVYTDLCELGLKWKQMPNDKLLFQKYLKYLGWEIQPMPKKDDGTKFTIAEFSKLNNRGIYIVSVANHLTCVKDGNVYDIWNCSNKCVYKYWTMEK